MSVSAEPEQRRRLRVLDVVVAVVVLLFLAALLIPAVRDSRERAKQMCCAGDLKLFGLTMLMYEHANGRFPPAYLADQDGRPAHSWRVLLLQYMAATDLYKRYDFKQPWDAPENRALAEGLPLGMGGEFPVYHCLSDRQTDVINTSYATFVGKDTFSAGPTGRTIDDITDGLANTMWLGEFAESGIHWMEPRDLQFDAMSFKINDYERPSIRSKHAGGVVHVSLMDMSVHTMSNDTDPSVLRALLTVAAGDVVDMTKLNVGQ